MSTRTVFTDFQRNTREQVQIALDEYQGTPIIDVRTWWQDKDGELKPGRTGISLSVKHLPSLAAGFAAAEAEARKRGLIGDDE